MTEMMNRVRVDLESISVGGRRRASVGADVTLGVATGQQRRRRLHQKAVL